MGVFTESQQRTYKVTREQLRHLSNDIQYCQLKFMVIGDWGDIEIDGVERQQNVSVIMNKWAADNGCDFILSTGDNFYPDGVDTPDDPRLDWQWRDMYSGSAIKDLIWYQVLGNHDHRGDNNEENQLEFATTEPRFYLPWYWYTYSKQQEDYKVQFFAVDSESIRKDKYDPDSQLADLEAALESSDAEWKIVFNHHPPYSCGKRWGDLDMIEDVVPIVNEYNVDLFLSGHDHCLQHITETGREYPKMDFVVSGGGGRYAHPKNDEHEEIINSLGFQSDFYGPNHGFAAVEINKDTMKVEYFTYVMNEDQSGLDYKSLYSFERNRNSMYV